MSSWTRNALWKSSRARGGDERLLGAAARRAARREADRRAAGPCPRGRDSRRAGRRAARSRSGRRRANTRSSSSSTSRRACAARGRRARRHGPAWLPGSRAAGPSGSGHGASAGRIASEAGAGAGSPACARGGAGGQHLRRRGREAGHPSRAMSPGCRRLSRVSRCVPPRRLPASRACSRSAPAARAGPGATPGRCASRTPPDPARDPAVAGSARARAARTCAGPANRVEGPVPDQLDDHLREGHVGSAGCGRRSARRGSRGRGACAVAERLGDDVAAHRAGAARTRSAPRR